MFLENEYKSFLSGRELAPSTISTEIGALKRIERLEGVDLEAEIGRNALADLIHRFRYSVDDERAQRPNPTRLPIEPEKLRRDLGWYRTQLERYLRFRQGSDPTIQSPPEIAQTDSTDLASEEAAERAFQLEADLQRELRRNISQLESGLRIIDDGHEVQVEAGFIDILCRDSGNRLVVIELKAGVARASVVAQILAYMATVADVHEGDIRGIIISSDFEPRVRHAVRAVPNVSLKRYSYSFRFEDHA